MSLVIQPEKRASRVTTFCSRGLMPMVDIELARAASTFEQSNHAGLIGLAILEQAAVAAS